MWCWISDRDWTCESSLNPWPFLLIFQYTISIFQKMKRNMNYIDEQLYTKKLVGISALSSPQRLKCCRMINIEYVRVTVAKVRVSGRYRCYLQHLWWFYTLFMADSSSSNSVLYYSSSINLFTKKYGDTQLPGILELILFWQQGYQVTKVTRLPRLPGYQGY